MLININSNIIDSNFSIPLVMEPDQASSANNPP
jgi:hypothetical protein